MQSDKRLQRKTELTFCVDSQTDKTDPNAIPSPLARVITVSGLLYVVCRSIGGAPASPNRNNIIKITISLDTDDQ